MSRRSSRTRFALLSAALACGSLIAPAAASAADFNPAPGAYTVNTSEQPPTIQGPGVNESGELGSIAVFNFDNVNIPDGAVLTVNGVRPLRIVASGNLVLAGTIDGAANSATNFVSAANEGGPGGGRGGIDFTQPGQGPGGGRSPSNGNNGGGGGGFGGPGATGGISFGDPGTAGAPGPAYGDLSTSLQGGSGGGGASDGGFQVGGGGGGGAIALHGNTVTIAATGVINVNGGNGAVGGNGASGGGSGGAIVLRGETVDNTGTLTANGGQGGSGGCCGDGGGGGGGRIAFQYRTLVNQGTPSVAGGPSAAFSSDGCCLDGSLNTPDPKGADGVVSLVPAPAVNTNAATAVTQTTATLNGTINPNGNATTYFFEYGTTTAYGARIPLTGGASAGGDATARAVSQDVIGLVPNTTYHFRVVAANALGFVTNGEDLTFTTPAVPVSDADRDGVPVPQDCNDTNPAIRPGAKDTPGNGVDEDCSGADATVVLRTGFSNKWTIFGSYTTVFRLTVKRVPSGSTVRLACKGKGCPFKKKTVKTKRLSNVKLTKYFKKGKKAAKLRPKVKVSITVTKPNTIGNWFQAKVRKGKKFPKTKQGCLAVGSRTAKIACPRA